MPLLTALFWCATLAVRGPLAAEGGWQWPLAGEPQVMRGFDPPAERWLAGHRGVDLRARPGETVLAAGPGVVGYAGPLAGRGVVTIHHPNGLETTYEPVNATVTPGDRVDVGDVLGEVTAGHGDCGWGYACLHWGLRRGESYLDPLQLVGVGPLRLLPLDEPLAAPPRQAPTAVSKDADSAADRAPPAVPLVAGIGLVTGSALVTSAVLRRRRAVSA